LDADAGADAGARDETRAPWQGWPSLQVNVATSAPIGFSQDDRYLGYQVSVCDPCPDAIVAEGPLKPSLYLAELWEPGAEGSAGYEARKKAHDANIARQVAQLGLRPYAESRTLRGPFPYEGANFAFETASDLDKGTVTVRMGVKLPGEEPVLPVTLTLGPMIMVNRQPPEQLRGLTGEARIKARREWVEQFMIGEPDLLYANVSKDGRFVGFVAHSPGVMWQAQAASAMRSTKPLMSVVYDETGMRHHRAQRYAKAASYFERAVAEDPDSSRRLYNLARAYARLHDARTELTLRQAVRRGGHLITALAKMEADFEDVAQEAWFKKL
jgi:tetratricopeptide (TPR) repeat protein